MTSCLHEKKRHPLKTSCLHEKKRHLCRWRRIKPPSTTTYFTYLSLLFDAALSTVVSVLTVRVQHGREPTREPRNARM